jgi:hypothetical protein
MNIHFAEQSLFENLCDAALCRLEVGSKMYGLQHAESDTDYLYILPRTVLEEHSFLFSYHQFQYKDPLTPTDHNFTSLYAFINNCLSGESTINFECLHSEILKVSPLGFLSTFAPQFANYNIIRAYLGFCERDIKHYARQKDTKDKASAIIHIHRGFSFAQSIFDNQFQLVNPELIEFANKVRQDYQNGEYQLYEEKLFFLRDKVKQFRQETINKALANKQLVRIMSLEYQRALDRQLQTFVKQDFYKSQQTKISEKNAQKMQELLYDANENWVSY